MVNGLGQRKANTQTRPVVRDSLLQLEPCQGTRRDEVPSEYIGASHMVQQMRAKRLVAERREYREQREDVEYLLYLIGLMGGVGVDVLRHGADLPLLHDLESGEKERVSLRGARLRRGQRCGQLRAMSQRRHVMGAIDGRVNEWENG